MPGKFHCSFSNVTTSLDSFCQQFIAIKLVISLYCAVLCCNDKMELVWCHNQLGHYEMLFHVCIAWKNKSIRVWNDTWGWVNNDRTVCLRWNSSLKDYTRCNKLFCAIKSIKAAFYNCLSLIIAPLQYEVMIGHV